MAERAGLVLGAIPLILFALDKYQECLEFGRSYAKYKDTLMSIRDEVSIQQFLFHDTIKKMGLDKPTYAELKECLQTNFPENHMQFMGYIRKMADTTDELMDKLEVETNKQTGDISSHVGWEWRRVKRHFSSKERKRIFDKLQHSNNKFRAILTESGVPLEESSPDIESFHLTELSYRTSSSSLTDLSCHAVSRADDALAAKGIEVNHKKDAMGDRNRASKLGPEEHRLGPRISDQFTWRSRLPKNERPTIVYADDVHETHAMMLLRSSNFGEHTRSLRQKGTVFCATVPEPGCANLSRHPGETSHKAGIGRAIEGNQRQGEKLLQDHEVICHTLPDTDNVDQEHGQHASLSERGQSRSPSDMDSVASSEESMVDLDNPPLTLEVSRLRSWLLKRSKSEHFCRHLQHRLTHRQCGSPTSQDKSTGSSPKSAFESLFSSATASSCKKLDGSKRGRDRRSDKDKQQDKRRRTTPDEPAFTSTHIPRLACLYNKYDPMMYRSNAQTLKKFEICGSHDFQNMNKL